MNHHPAFTVDRGPCRRNRRRTVLIACAFAGLLSAGGLAKGDSTGQACSNTARYANTSCRYEALGDYWQGLGKCENLSASNERTACKKEASRALREALVLCGDQLDARREVCGDLGEGRYDPAIDPADFADEITNPFFPLAPGTTRVYESQTEEGLEQIEVKVTHETKEILGVLCTVVRDTVTIGGDVVEDTLDWFAQDKLGNVWYFGEHSMEFEGGMVSSLHGSWEAGVDGAKPGIIMEAEPQVDDIYRQEFFLGEAEDMAEVIALNQSVTVFAGTFDGCVQTKDFTPIEPDAIEHKYYAPGSGVVLIVHPDTGRRTELIGVIQE